MRVVGLTGSIACGKSTVSRCLRAEGIPVIDGDALSRELTADGGVALPAIREAFGNGVFTADGSLDRKALGRIVFSSPAELEKLNALMAPLLRELTRSRLEALRSAGTPLCFLEMPLLFEQGYNLLCDAVWCVWLPESEQETRLMARDGCTAEEARQRMNSVLSSDEKAARSDVVIDNSGSEEATLSSLPPLIASEKLKAQPRRRRSERYQTARDEAPDADAAPHETVSAPVPRSETQIAPSEAAIPAEIPIRQPSPAAPAPVMDRPATARRAPSRRRAAWRMPRWMMIALCSCAALLAVSVTALSLMSAYLTRQAELHAAEQQAIDENYPMLYRDLIESAAAEYNLNPAYVCAIIRNESSFRPMAESAVGARGLMQLMPDTAEWIAHKLRISGYAFDRMYDPASNIRFGCWYLHYLSDLFQGDPISVTCAYHAGQGEIAGWLSSSEYTDNGVSLLLDRLPEGPTKSYAGRVTRDYGIYQTKYFSSDAGADDSDGAAQP